MAIAILLLVYSKIPVEIVEKRIQEFN